MMLFLVTHGLLLTIALVSGEQQTRDNVGAKPLNASAICATQPSWTLIASAQDCRKFYVCVNRIAQELRCAEEFHFDGVEKRCVRGTCSASATQYCEPADAALQRVEGDCTAYSMCRNGLRAQLACRKGRYFDATTATCRTIADTAQHKCSCVLKEGAIITNPDDCETYYVCTAGKAVLEQCPHDQYYDERINSCVIDLVGVCLMAPTTPPPESDIHALCMRYNLNGAIFQSYPDDCAKYYVCINKQLLTKECPSGYYYDTDMHYCRPDTMRKCVKQNTLASQSKQSIEVSAAVAELEQPLKKPRPSTTKYISTIKGVKKPEKLEHVQNSAKEPMPKEILPIRSEEVSIEAPQNSEIDSNLPTQLKPPAKTTYNKLASKFITFD